MLKQEYVNVRRNQESNWFQRDLVYNDLPMQAIEKIKIDNRTWNLKLNYV